MKKIWLDPQVTLLGVEQTQDNQPSIKTNDWVPPVSGHNAECEGTAIFVGHQKVGDEGFHLWICNGCSMPIKRNYDHGHME
ncbi:hypothetical protein [Niameybacter sp.]|uniref:hypothetical protein n=1 Tax=Niameybacter sp. TaxID=2033640 RepID=UPI002FC9CC41